MKIISADEMTRIEEAAYQRQGPELAARFMEGAGAAIAAGVKRFMASRAGRPPLPYPIHLLAGKGNNAGDAYTAGRLLLSEGFSVSAWDLAGVGSHSPLCARQREAFKKAGGTIIPASDGEVHLSSAGLIIDGIFGTGFRGEVPPPIKRAIRIANGSGLPIIAIDVPSGLTLAPSRDGTYLASAEEGAIIHAGLTFALGFPKTCMFYHQAFAAVGALEVLDFGLPPQDSVAAQSSLTLLDPMMAAALLPPLAVTRHKYQAGLVTVFAGSPGMEGAALLACQAALRTGAGMVVWFHPEPSKGLHSCPLEVITRPRKTTLTNADRKIVAKSKAALIGPGLSLSAKSRKLLLHILSEHQAPVVLDADALNLYGLKPYPLPPGSILTPHRGELQRLMQLKTLPELSPRFFASLQKFVDKTSCTVVLKGKPTYIVHPGVEIHCSVLGNPGMATAGSGDVLAGMIAALRAQGLSAHHAALLGVYLHGRAGDLAGEAVGLYSLVASDIIAQLGNAIQEVQQPSS